MLPGRQSLRRWVFSLTVLGSLLGFAAPAHAAPSIDRIEHIADRWVRVFVDSPSMGAVEVQVLLPRNTSRPRPTVYLLDGRSADESGNHWTSLGDAVRFFDDKDVNVVLTVGGTASYYTDWQRSDPQLGTYKWETFLTKELPPLIDSEFAGNGRNAVAGVSMGAQGALMLSVRAPELYRAVAGYSGCYTATDAVGQAQMRLVVGSFRGNADNMFGPEGGPDWAAHDVVAHAEALRGKTIYLSSGSGVPGAKETTESATFGAPIEAVTNYCTHQLADRLTALNIPATTNFRSTGTHAWQYWADDLEASWPVIDKALSN